MQRWITALVGLAVVVSAIWIGVRNFHLPRPIESVPSSGRTADGQAMRVTDGGLLGDDSGALVWTDLTGIDTRADGGVGMILPDGSPVPPLPFTAPRQIRFGVVLVSYAGAQPSAGGARPVARSKSDARVLADRLLATARQDFHAAVQQGDTGSAEDLGHVKVGILEAAPEFVLFTLPIAGVGGPIDTPRGYWIVKRLE
jgi:hypothetical protein